MTDNNKEILKKANAAILLGDKEGFLSFCTEDTKWIFVGDKTLDGKQAVREWMEIEYKEPPRFYVTDLIEDGNFLAALGTIATTGEDGKENSYNYCDVWRFRDGKMAELRSFVIDSASAK